MQDFASFTPELLGALSGPQTPGHKGGELKLTAADGELKLTAADGAPHWLADLTFRCG